MANAELEPVSVPPADARLESGSYEIIRNRLRGHGRELRSRLDQLNEARKEVFGSIDTLLLATERVSTTHHCIPRDLAALKNRFLFGYNVHFGLKATTNPEDVFGVYEFRDQTFHELDLELILDPQFVRDFGEIYRYYKDATFSRFFSSSGSLYMVFQIGRTPADIKALKWQIEGDRLRYVDNRSDHEVRLPPQHEFEWKRTRREQHRFGRHPHIAIEDRLFVETIGGDLTIKVENNTDSGAGIYAEDVKDKDQTLDDAEIYYAIVGNLILLRIRPYNEGEFRFIVFNEKTRQARRWDAIQHCCILLPDDHGLIFPNGFFLQSGEAKMFDSTPSAMVFEGRTSASNGEDYLYVFRNLQTGESALLQYNVIQQQVDTPLICHGATILQRGELICFKHEQEPQRHHALQIWQTPYHADDVIPPADTESFLYKIGNRDIVRGMAECQEVLGLIEKDDSYSNLYVDLQKACGDIVDSYFWIGRDETANLREPLLRIREAAGAAIEEFEKVIRVRRNTEQQTREMETRAREIAGTIQRHRFDTIDQFVTSLSQLRGLRGETIGLRELRYVDLERVEKLEKQVAEEMQRLSHRCVQFLLQPASLAPYDQQVTEHAGHISALKTVAEARKLEEQVSASASELEMLIDVVGNLKIDDATQRTAIVDSISAIFAKINHARSQIRARQKELMSAEGIAEFSSQLKLLNQAVVNYLEVCETPAKCDELLTKLAIQIEELEGRFAEFDEFVIQLAEKRDEVYNAFESRKLGLIEARNRRAAALMSAADRILRGIKGRLEALSSINEIHAYFASDLMIEKVRDIVRQLTGLDDSVRVDDIQSRLRALREDAIRQLKDRQELFVSGENVIQFGRHRFAVNVQPLDLTTIVRDGSLQLHLTGTNFFEPLQDEALEAARDLWQQELVSENGELYRGEFLAYRLFQLLDEPGGLESARVLKMSDEERLEWVRQFMGPRYQEGYVKGVHDSDAVAIVRAMSEMKGLIGLLQYHPRSRAMAMAYWKYFCPPQEKSRLGGLLRGHSAVLAHFPRPEQRAAYTRELADVLRDFANASNIFSAEYSEEAAGYLYEECVRDVGFVISRQAADLHDAFFARLRAQQGQETFRKSIDAVRGDSPLALRLARDWAEAFTAEYEENVDRQATTMPRQQEMYVDEFALLLLEGKLDTSKIVDGQVSRHLTALAGAHGVIHQGNYGLHYNRFLRKMAVYDRNVVPRFERFVQRKKAIVEQARVAMRLSEFQAKVLTSFVRNKLIDTVYLPLIGDNLAKQIGAAGDQKRSDRSGLLLLVSPPGYGKTTLMEYIANRLGLVFMKINGPAIGHQVTSLDPKEASNAAAREELERLNLALEMGDNVMLYLDDIQHCHAEFLQKFISLCDAQRKIEGVYRGRTRTYDLRGRKVAVVMAGNPYTESGEKFQIPDMLSNRADIYNLGEIIGDSQDAFELSYLENALTSNPILGKLASRSQRDIYAIIRMAETSEPTEGELEGNYSPDELNEMTAVLKKLLRIRDVVLTVNRQYIRSAAQADEYRTEPPFKLQGSYRNMNRIAEKVVPIMNDQELQNLIISNYENDAQTLASDTESNLLKFKELIGILTPRERQRWDDICRAFRQNLKLKGVGSDDTAGLVIAQLGSLTDGLESIRQALLAGTTQLESRELPATLIAGQLEGVTSRIDALRHEWVAALQQAANQLTPPTAGARSSHSSELDEGTQRMIVQHKVPRSILEVVQSQFEVMRQWLLPLQQATTQQGAEFRQLHQSVEACLETYGKLLGELETARKRGTKP